MQVKLRGGFHGDSIQIGSLDFRIARPREGPSAKAAALPAGTARRCCLLADQDVLKMHADPTLHAVEQCCTCG